MHRAGEEIHANKLRHRWKIVVPDDWNDELVIPAALAGVHSEVSEAYEAFRVSDREAFEEELADIVIHVIGLAHGLGIDLKGAILAKIEKNKTREYRHGGKRV